MSATKQNVVQCANITCSLETSCSFKSYQLIKGADILKQNGGQTHALKTQWWSCLESANATSPKKCNQHPQTRKETGEQLVVTE